MKPNQKSIGKMLEEIRKMQPSVYHEFPEITGVRHRIKLWIKPSQFIFQPEPGMGAQANLLQELVDMMKTEFLWISHEAPFHEIETANKQLANLIRNQKKPCALRIEQNGTPYEVTIGLQCCVIAPEPDVATRYHVLKQAFLAVKFE